MKIKQEPTWDAGIKMPSFPKLNKSIEADVAVIGGGISGLICTYLLTKEKKKVVLLEKNKLCLGATGVTTAFLTQSIDTDLKKLINMYGKEAARLISYSHQKAIDIVEKIIRKNKIECDFRRCSNYIYAIDENAINDLKEEGKTAKNLGISMQFKKNDLKFRNYGYLELPNQAKFHPLKYLSSIAKIIDKQRTQIFEDGEVTDIKGEGPYILKTNSGKVKAKYIIVSTYSPFDKKLFFKKASYDSYVFELQVPSNILQEGIYEDTLNPYHYFRVDKKGKFDRVIIGGEDHRSDLPVNDSKNFQALEGYAKKIFPFNYKIIRKWKGPIVESIDGLAFIGEYKNKNIFYTTGFSGNGMTYAHISAVIIKSKILGEKNKETEQIASLYDPKRIPTLKQLANKGVDYTEELLHGAIKNSLEYRENAQLKSPS